MGTIRNIPSKRNIRVRGMIYWCYMTFESFPKTAAESSKEFHSEEIPEINDGSHIEWEVRCGKCGQEGHSSAECPNA